MLFALYADVWYDGSTAKTTNALRYEGWEEDDMKILAKGRVEVTVTHSDGKVDAGYYVETTAVGEGFEALVREYANEFAMCTALIYMQPQEYTDLALDETEFSQLAPGVH